MRRPSSIVLILAVLLILPGCTQPTADSPTANSAIKDTPAGGKEPASERPALPGSRERSDRPAPTSLTDSTIRATTWVLPPPPFAATPPSLTKAAQASFQLLPLAEVEAGIAERSSWLARQKLSLPVLAVPGSPRSGQGSLPAAVPLSFSGDPLYLAIDQGDFLLLVYGPKVFSGRYLARFDRSREQVDAVWDFQHYLRPPQVSPTDQALAVEGIRWAWITGSNLYVGHAHPTYAAATAGLNGYISAIDLGSNMLRWRSPPLVFNSQQFVVYKDGIISAYGFTREPDYVYVLSRQSGQVVQRLPLKSAAEDLVVKDDNLWLRAYDRAYQFGIRSHTATTAVPATPPRDGS